MIRNDRPTPAPAKARSQKSIVMMLMYILCFVSGVLMLFGSSFILMVGQIGGLMWIAIGLLLSVYNIGCLVSVFYLWREPTQRYSQQTKILASLIAIFWFVELPILILGYVGIAGRLAI